MYVANLCSLHPSMLHPLLQPQPTSLSRADSGTTSNAAMTASEQELSEKSPSDRGGENGSGSESGSAAKGPEKTVAESKLGSRERGTVEQEGQGLEEIPAAAVEEEGRQDSESTAPCSVRDSFGFEIATEVEEDPLDNVDDPPPKETLQSSLLPMQLPQSTSLPEDIPATSCLKGAPSDTSLPKEVERSGTSSHGTPSESSSSTAPTEVKDAVGNQEEGPPPPEVGERVFVETASGLKMGVVKYVGETQFQSGLWIGVALERPSGGQCDVMHV